MENTITINLDKLTLILLIIQMTLIMVFGMFLLPNYYNEGIEHSKYFIYIFFSFGLSYSWVLIIQSLLVSIFNRSD